MRQIGDKVFIFTQSYGDVRKPILAEAIITGVQEINSITTAYTMKLPGNIYGKVKRYDHDVYSSPNEAFNALWETRLKFEDKQEVKNDD